MKIGIVCYPTVGGSGIVATELGHALASRGHDVHFISYEIPFKLQIENPHIFFHPVYINNYELFQYPDYALPLAVKIAEVSTKYDLDILHVHYAIPHTTSAYLARQLLKKKKPAIITTLHGTDITLVGKNPNYRGIVKFSMEQSDLITAVSNNLREQTIEYFKSEKTIEVIHNFFIPQPELIGKKPLRQRFVENEEKLILHSSNFRTIKRAEDVIRIFEKIRKKIPSKLILLGYGSEIQNLREMVAELNLNNHVFFIGKITSVDPYTASSDLFLLPSSQESFGLAALEAMAYGVPVVASNAGGLPELIQQGETGFLAPVGDVEAMSDFSIQLLQDHKLYQHISNEGRKQAKEKFSVEVILPKYESCYTQATLRL
jgi:N-acetyl-alpha-D-glucosaminyl L-malate synthase BshA